MINVNLAKNKGYFSLLSVMLLVGSVLLLNLSAVAQGLSARLSVTESIHDFGRVSGRELLRHTFPIKNTGTKELEIKGITVSCGCVKQAELDGPAKIKPGQQVRLAVTLEVAEAERQVQESVQIETNDPARKVFIFVLKAIVDPPITVNPTVVNFGEIDSAKLPSTVELLVKNNRAVTEADTISTENYSPVAMEILKVEQGKWKIRCTLPEKTPLGLLSSQIILKPSWGTPKTLLVIGEVVGNVSVNPDELYIRRNRKLPFNDVFTFSADAAQVLSLKILNVSPPLDNLISSTVKGSSIALVVTSRGTPSLVNVRGKILVEVSLSTGRVHQVSIPVIFE